MKAQVCGCLEISPCRTQLTVNRNYWHHFSTFITKSQLVLQDFQSIVIRNLFTSILPSMVLSVIIALSPSRASNVD